MLPWLYVLCRWVSGEYTIVFLVQSKVGMDIFKLVCTYTKDFFPRFFFFFWLGRREHIFNSNFEVGNNSEKKYKTL